MPSLARVKVEKIAPLVQQITFKIICIFVKSMSAELFSKKPVLKIHLNASRDRMLQPVTPAELKLERVRTILASLKSHNTTAST